MYNHPCIFEYGMEGSQVRRRDGTGQRESKAEPWELLGAPLGRTSEASIGNT